MKSNIILFAYILLLSSCTCCSSTKKTSYRETRLKSDLSPEFIPVVNGVLTFQSDSGKTLQFENVTTEHAFTDHDRCDVEECCEHVVNVEWKRLLVTSMKMNFTFQFLMQSEDSTDSFRVWSGKIFSDPSGYESSVEYANNGFRNLRSMLNHTDTTCVFYDSLTLNNKNYKEVFRFQGTPLSQENKKYAEVIYYTKSAGLVAFAMSDQSLWTKK